MSARQCPLSQGTEVVAYDVQRSPTVPFAAAETSRIEGCSPALGRLGLLPDLLGCHGQLVHQIALELPLGGLAGEVCGEWLSTGACSRARTSPSTNR